MGVLSDLLALLGRKSPPVPVTLYSRSDCHLCEVMMAELARAGLADQYTLSVVDIGTDERLVAAHGRSIPVLEIGGRVAFKGRLTAAEFQRKFARLAREWRQREAGG